jgi:cell division protein FtsA
VIPIAGDQITSDIAMALRTPTGEAEEIKIRYGVAKQVLADPGETLEVPGLGDRGPRTLSRQALAAVIEPRVEELFAMVHQVVRESGYEGVLSSGIVLTGGTSIMPGMIEMAEDIFLEAGAPRHAGLSRPAGRRGAQPALRDGARPAAGSEEAVFAGPHRDASGWLGERRCGSA